MSAHTQIFEMSQKKRDRCLQEVTLLAQLTHPYIIQMLDAFIDENMLIIIFEWAPAGTWGVRWWGAAQLSPLLHPPTHTGAGWVGWA